MTTDNTSGSADKGSDAPRQPQSDTTPDADQDTTRTPHRTPHPPMSTAPLKVLVATRRTQGSRPGDSIVASVADGDLVDFASMCARQPRNCGCTQSFVALHNRFVTTTAEVVERPITVEDYAHALTASIRGTSASSTLDKRDRAVAEDLLRIAALWPVGTVVERDGKDVVVRVMGLGPTDMSAEFQPGDRVRFVSTTDPELYSLLRPGALGTVAVTDDIGTIHINWDDGSCLGMILHDGTDVIERTD